MRNPRPLLVVGIGTKRLTGTVQPGTFENWLAAAPVPATPEHKMELFRSSGKIFRDDNELFSEPSWIAVMVGQGIVPPAHHPFADQPSEAELQALMARVRALRL